MFVSINDSSSAYYSYDGIDWTWVDVEENDRILYSIAYGGGKFVAVGADGKAFYTSKISARLLFNQDGSVTWKKAQ
jgi:hypothetical protein